MSAGEWVRVGLAVGVLLLLWAGALALAWITSREGDA